MAESATQSLGRQTELFVESRLMSEGLQPVARNFRCKQGEIDLIMLDGQSLVFVEVRYRRPNRYVSAAQTVNRAKQRKLCNAAAVFLSRHRQFADNPARFDVVGLDGPNVREFTIQWLKDAFRPRSDRF